MQCLLAAALWIAPIASQRDLELFLFVFSVDPERNEMDSCDFSQ